MADPTLLVLLDDYNFYRTKTNHFQKLQQERPYMRLPKLNAEREKLLGDMVEWCRGHGLDPRHWLYCLFARNRWLFAPKMTPGFLMSKTGLAWYKAKSKTVDTRPYRERLSQTRAVEQAQDGGSPVYDPNIHISAEVEARKQRHLHRGDHEVCMAQAFDGEAPTLGFHPGSRVCRVCPAAVACADKIRGAFPFDIVALREGKITVQQATLAAAVSRGRS